MNLMRTTLLLLSAVSIVSCGTFKPAAKTQFSTNYTSAESSSSKSNPQFLNVKAVQPQKFTTNHSSNGGVQSVNAFTNNINSKPKNTNVDNNVKAEGFNMLQIKYAIVLDVPAESITNIKLYSSINSWYGTRYCFGGTTKRGVDCSSLMQHLYDDTYNMSIPRTAVTQYRATKRINQEELQEGDLIFFHTTRSGISHVGFYLGNRKFVHASSSRGVTISSLDENYYVKAYRGAGRFDENYVNTDN